MKFRHRQLQSGWEKRFGYTCYACGPRLSFFVTSIDPNPSVIGKGTGLIKVAGIVAITGVLWEEVEH